jgi:hypothetical protein
MLMFDRVQLYVSLGVLAFVELVAWVARLASH